MTGPTTDIDETDVRRRSRAAGGPVFDAAGGAPGGWERPVVALYWGAAALVVAVIAWHGIRAVATHWIPVGDDAFLAVRSRAVFSAHPPLLSSASSAGADAAVTYNHPGPAVLWLASPFVRLFGSSSMALAIALVNSLAVGAVAWCARRAARASVAAGVLAATAALVWAMGSEVLIDPWNPHVATLAFLALAVATWAVVQGWWIAAPIGTAFGALAAQTHLSFVAVCSVLGAGLLVAVVVRAVRSAESEERRRWWVGGAAAVGAGLVVLAPTLVEQVAHGSDGNLARILEGSGSGSSAVTVAPSQAASVVAAVLVRPPWFVRGSWGLSMFPSDLPSARMALVGLAAVAAVVAAAATCAVRRRDGAVLGLLAVATVAAATGTLASLAYPLRVGVPIAYFRWLWPAAALLAAGLLVPVVETVARRAGRRWPAVASGGAAYAALAAVALFAVLNLPVANDDLSGSGRWGRELSLDVLEQAGGRLDELSDPVEVVPSLQEGPLMAFTGALIDHLDAAGVDVRSADPVIVQQLGEQHRATGSEPWVLVMDPDTGPDAGPAGGELIATVQALDATGRRSLDRRVAVAADSLEGASAALTAAGRATGNPALEQLAGPIEDPERFLHDRVLADALTHDLLRIEPRDGVTVDPDALASLSRSAFHADGRTFSLWLVPRADWEATR